MQDSQGLYVDGQDERGYYVLTIGRERRYVAQTCRYCAHGERLTKYVPDGDFDPIEGWRRCEYCVTIDAPLPGDVAQREWYTRARVRILEDVTTGSVDPNVARHWRKGQELVMVQWGRSGRAVKRDSWWTSFDIDGAHIIDANKVDVIAVLEEVLPW